MKAAYSELHAHSAFSFLLGASQPEAMIRRAAELGIESIAITDRAGFYGSARAHHAARECGIRALVGCMLDLPDGSRFPVLCATRDGYRMLSRHLTDRHLSPDEEHGVPANGNLVALTGDRDGPVCRPLLRDDKKAALDAATRLIERFGHGNVYVEITRHGLRDDGRLNRHLIDLASHLRLPLLASNAPLHATRGDRRLADAFACLRHHVPLDGAGCLLAPNGERHLKSPCEMAALFADLPEAVANTRRLAERIGFTLQNLDYRFPDFPDGRGNPLSVNEQTTLLRRFAYAGASRRYGVCSQKVKCQLEHELALIHKLGFPGYFLIVHDLVEFARGRGILCQGRGSAANSVVCYALGITAVDPVGGGLLFERFLIRKPQELAGYRHRLPLGRATGGGHPACLREIRRAQRGHDRQRDHLPLEIRVPRDVQGARFSTVGGGSVFRQSFGFSWRGIGGKAAGPGSGVRGPHFHHPPARSSSPRRARPSLSDGARDAAPPRPALRRHDRLRPRARLRQSRSSPPPCPAAPSCSGTRTTARTSAS